MSTNAETPYQLKFADVFGDKMAYVDEGYGDPIVFIHGNPTSSYMWRNIMPHLEGKGRLIAPDMMGMGASAKLSGGDARYTFAEQSRYLAQLLKQLGVTERVTLVLHDWGCAMGFHWATHHSDAIKAIAYMEALVLPMTWKDWEGEHQATFQELRGPAGEAMILENNMMVDGVVPELVFTPMSEAVFDNYRKPYLTAGEDRRATLTWARQIPIDGTPSEVVDIVLESGAWLEKSVNVPKLFINGSHAEVLKDRFRDYCRTWPNQTEVIVPGIHFFQEDAPDEIGKALASWFDNL